MNRRNIFFANLVLLVGFAAGYAAAFLTVKKANQLSQATPAPVIITQVSPAPADVPAEAKAAQPVAADTSTDVAVLQAQLAEKNNQIKELQMKVSDPSHETVTPEEDTPEYREKLASDLMELTKSKEMIQQSFRSSAQMIGKELNLEGQEALTAALQKHYSWDKMEKSFSKIYTEVFSAQELSDMAEFYRSDVGTSMVKKQPEVIQKTMQVMAQVNQEILPKFQADLEAIMKKNGKDKPKTATSKTETPTKN